VQTYYLQDGLGSTPGLANGSGSVTDTYGYDVFGATKSHTGSSANVWKYTGEQNDSTVARSPYYLRARYYDPANGRFLTRDPWPANPMNPQSLNRYPYVLNNPALLVDPYGLVCIGHLCSSAVTDKVGDAVGAAAGAAQWVGDDYHWATVGAAVGGAAFFGGVVLLAAPVSVPMLTTALISGGLSADVSFTVIGAAHSGKECSQGNRGSCVSAVVASVCLPLGFLPGVTGIAATAAPVVTDIGVSAANASTSGAGAASAGLQCPAAAIKGKE